MFDLQRFLEGLDLLYASGKGREAEGYLKRGLKEAASCGDDGAILAILNELMDITGRQEDMRNVCSAPDRPWSLRTSWGLTARCSMARCC